MDADPTARTAELKVKIAAEVAPVPPTRSRVRRFGRWSWTRLQIHPVVGLQRSRPRVMFALRASGMRRVAAAG